ncbi:MAG: glycosyltransferase [Bacteroidetes bacterium]|nr:glycosyltransferase [Bacteroidota bacterium]
MPKKNISFLSNNHNSVLKILGDTIIIFSKYLSDFCLSHFSLRISKEDHKQKTISISSKSKIVSLSNTPNQKIDVFYYIPFYFSDYKNNGIHQKYLGIWNALNKNNISSEFYALLFGKGPSVIDMDDFKTKSKEIGHFVESRFSAFKRVFIGNYFRLLKKVDFSKFSHLHLRYSFSNYFFITFLKQIKTKYPNIIISIEIATFPYDKEMKDLPKYLILLIDKYYRRKLHKYVDKIVCCTDIQSIYGIDVISFSNGFEPITTLPSDNFPEPQPKILNILAIASNISIWHGFDRVIMGMADYIKNNDSNICLHLIGDGTEKDNLEKLANHLGISTLVNFYGYKYETELLEIAQTCDFAIGTLGMHRKGVNFDSSLKSRFYASLGLPFILSTNDICFDNKLPYWKYVEGNDNAIHMDLVIDFYLKLRETNPNFRAEMIEYCGQNLSWENTFKNVITFFKTENKVPTLSQV